MHMGIAIVVYAKDRKEATSKAMDIADSLCCEQYPFDYHRSYGRCEDFPDLDFSMALPLDDDRILDLLKENHTATKRAFMCNAQKVLDAIKDKTPEEMWNIENDMWKYYTYQIGKYEGSDIFVYDDNGEGIRDDGHFRRVITKYNDSEYLKDMKVFVLFQDMHY